MSKENFLYFIISGAVAAGLNFGSRFMFSWFVPYEVAIVMAFFVGLLSGFLLMRFFVFEGAGKPVVPQIKKYILVNLFALLQTFLISLSLARWIFPSFGIRLHAEALGHLIGVLLPVLTSYFGHKYFTFRERE